jgi:ubiquinone/menaquinone biosynthesis C-methylase UbiE
VGFRPLISNLTEDFGMLINPEIEKYYSEYKKEPDRLEQHPLEKWRTQEIISRYLPNPPAGVLDIGGGAGVYSFWLSEQGYRVHLLDPVEYLLEEARMQAVHTQTPPEVIARGDARQLDYPDNTFDTVLMLGPLYHLVEINDRIQALKEANRVVKKNGVVISAYISRFAALADQFIKNLVKQPVWKTIMTDDSTTGRHTNPTGEPGFFTTAYFHRPEEIAPEMAAAGLAVEKVLALESFGSIIPGCDAKILDPDYREVLMDSIARVEEELSLIGISNHILGIGRKP